MIELVFIIENYVIEQLKSTILKDPYYFTFAPQYEIDYLIQSNDKIIPIEVKTGKTKKKKSLTEYNKKYHPEFSYRFSKLGFKHDGMIKNIPL